jgi:dihydroneopterin aldolase
MNWIELKGMNFYSYHGVEVQERKVGNSYTVDLRIGVDLRKAVETDHLGDTVNYASVHAIVKSEMAVASNLIEHAAHRIVRKVRQAFPEIEAIEIRLSKRNPPFGGDIREVAVVITE